MRQFKFRALLTLDAPAPGRQVRQYPSGTHALMIHAWQIGDLSHDKYFPAMILRDTEEPLQQGERAVVTVTVDGDDALSYLDAGQKFTIWGGCGGHGVISRRVFTDGAPS